ncbi:dermonecrotic toxin domain-containing protein [Pseudomonas sp. Pseusp122]|uniref:dermonecrotic toxin domain-containing protein n=1 Tax=unclassified Pseudomonas TaxID=196821 RepID=UPI0039A62F36
MQEHWKPAPKDRALDLLGEHSLELESRVAPSNTESLTDAPPDPARIRALQRLKALRKSPGSKLIAHSLLYLHAWQLDMDYPPPLRTYARKRLRELLEDQIPEPPSPDDIHITFLTEQAPAISTDGNEHFNLRLSLTELALACFDPPYFLALSRSPIKDNDLSPPIPGLPAAKLLALLRDITWGNDYEEQFSRFWNRHEKTWRALGKLAFLDQLARQSARKRISRDGYLLALDAIGLSSFPTSPACLNDSARGTLTEVHMLAINDELVPGIFQIRSKNTAHCFIHVMGGKSVIEYISDDPRQMAARLLEALRTTRGLVPLPQADSHGTEPRAVLVQEDLFDALTRLQKQRPLINGGDDPMGLPGSVDLLRPIKRSLALIAAVDLWNVQPDILKRIPVVQRSAAKVMGTALFNRYGLRLNPHEVFIRYLPGPSITPLGSARQPGNFVRAPSTRPISLGKALIDNYRVEQPVGYLDNDGRNVVYLDPTGKGEWAPDRALSISAQAIEDTVKSIDFLPLMSAQIIHFWDQHKDSIEQALQAGLIAQAVIALKRGQLTRRSFDTVVQGLAGNARLQWQVLGFNVFSLLFEGVERQYCAGLLVLEVLGKPGRILYQAGSTRAFMEFQSHEQLVSHLRNSAADEQWRQSVLDYIPARHHERLNYLLQIWGGVQPSGDSNSLLRPWAEGLYNPDVQEARTYKLYDTRLIDSPFAFMHQKLRDNQLEQAQTRIVTSREVSLRFWTRHLSHLQLLLAPMSLLMTPVALASLAVEVGLLSLHVATANLPGYRGEEKQQAILAALSLGLLDLSPATPRLLQSLRNLRRKAPVAAPSLAGKTPSRPKLPRQENTGEAVGKIERGRFTATLNHWLHPRRTQLERFFHTDSLLKSWTVPGNPPLRQLPVKAWKLGRRFLLWTSNKSQATTLLVSTHGYYMPWTRNVALPNGTTVFTYAPHGHGLVDPGLRHIAHRRVRPFAMSNSAGNTPLSSPTSLPPLTMTDKLMAGTVLPGHMKNYVLAKFQGTWETYDDICDVVSSTHRSPFKGQLPSKPMDVLTVRNRFAMAEPDVEELFTMLFDKGIHYDQILLVHCRCTALDTLFNQGSSYTAPNLPPRVVS